MKTTLSLKNNYEFRRLYSKGRNIASPFVVIYCRRNGKATNRLGITASTKFGNAVCRNRFRRRIREMYRLNETRLKTGWDIVAVARTKAKYASYHDIEADFLSALDKLGLIAK